MNIFGNLFGGFLYGLYTFTGDYGFALIIFTIIIKLILMPLNVKQIKSSMKMQELQPELKKLQDKYKDDREKLNEEMIKFYQNNNFNPASGCIMPLLQLPILMLLWQIVTKPITYMLKADSNVVTTILAELKAVDPKIIDETGIVFGMTRQFGEKLISQGIPGTLIDKVLNLQEGMHFLGIFNLAKLPTYDPRIIMQDPAAYLPLLLLVILAAAFTYISSKMMMVSQNNNQPKGKVSNEKQVGPFDPAAMQKSMLLMGPVMTLVFAFQLPAGLSLYWLATYVFQIFQQIYINKTIHEQNIDKPQLDVSGDITGEGALVSGDTVSVLNERIKAKNDKIENTITEKNKRQQNKTNKGKKR